MYTMQTTDISVDLFGNLTPTQAQNYVSHKPEKSSCDVCVAYCDIDTETS